MARRRRVSAKRSLAGVLVEVVGTIIIFWLIATVGIPYLVDAFSDRIGPTPAVSA
jgi:hypothetical protein